MKKIMNKPKDFVQETLEGIQFAYSDKLKFLDKDRRILVSAFPEKKGKVGIVTAGGSGHLPVFLGYVGKGMLDACVVGNVFASPSASKMAEAIRACDFGAGVLCLYGNYGGDHLNFSMAMEDVAFDEIDTIAIQVKDDVASSADPEKRRGVAGMVFAFKIAGAAAERMYSLTEVAAVTQKALDSIRSIGFALSPCILPEVGTPGFTIPEGKMELGMGIHGEPGISVIDQMDADTLAGTLLQKLLEDMPLQAGDTAAVMVNGLGATSLEELFILYRAVHRRLEDLGVSVYMPHIGEFATSMEMAGASLTLMKMDEELKGLMAAEAVTPFYTAANK